MNLQDIIDNVVKLPPSPQVLPKLQKALRDPQTGMDDLAALLRVDPGLAASVLRMANSAYFAGGLPCDSLEEAVARLGFGEVYKLVSLAVTAQLMGTNMSLYGLEKGELLTQSTACAVLMVEGGACLGWNWTDTLYTQGLLHSLGKIVINQYYQRHGLEIYSTADGPLSPETERQLLGFDHAQAGAALLRKWRFPEEIIGSVLHQLEPDDAPPPLMRGALLLHFARLGATILSDTMQSPGNLVDDESLVTKELQRAALKAGVPKPVLPELLASAREGCEEIQSLIHGVTQAA